MMPTSVVVHMARRLGQTQYRGFPNRYRFLRETWGCNGRRYVQQADHVGNSPARPPRATIKDWRRTWLRARLWGKSLNVTSDLKSLEKEAQDARSGPWRKRKTFEPHGLIFRSGRRLDRPPPKPEAGSEC